MIRIVSFVVFLCSICLTGCGPNLKSIEHKCDPIVNWLEQEFQNGNKYPISLPKKYTDVLERIPYKANYFSDGNRYSIGVGEYMKDGFVYHISSETGRWYLDR